jgi:hypothetical protein
MQGTPVVKMGGMHQSGGPASIPGLPAIPDGDPATVVLGLLKAAAADKLIPQLDAEIARLDRMAASSYVRIKESTPGSLYSTLRTQVATLARLERQRRRYLARAASLGGPADKPTGSVAEAVGGAIAGLRDDIPAAASRARELATAKLPEAEARIRSMLHTATQARTAIGPFSQDTLLDDLTAAVAERAKIVRLIKSKGDDLISLVEFLSPAEDPS